MDGLRDLGSAFPDVDLASLVSDLARGLRPPNEIWNEHGITSRDAAAAIMSSPRFRSMFAEARSEWEAPSNARARVKAKAMMSLEASLLEYHAAMIDRTQPLNHRVQAGNFVAKLAGLDAEVAAGGGGAGGVVVNIDLSGGSHDGVHFSRGAASTVDGEATEVEDEPDELPRWARDLDPDEEDDLLLSIDADPVDTPD